MPAASPMPDDGWRRPGQPSRRQLFRGAGLAALTLGAATACTPRPVTAAGPTTSHTPGAPAASPSVSSRPVPTPSRIVTASGFGAVGDGVTDDTAALRRALAALTSGEALRLDRGKVFCHSDVLSVTVPGVQLLGPGTLLATAEHASALQISADHVSVVGLTVAIARTTQRWSTPAQHKLFLGPHTGITIRDVTITGSAAAGLFSLGASDFVFQRVHVSDTRADGIHMTDGSNNGLVDSPVIERSGDDGVAVVSYSDDPALCHDITVLRPTVRTTTGGRGISVVGGQKVTYSDISVSASYAAGVYIACEGGDSVTYPTTQVRVIGGSVTDANTNTAIDHGAVLVYSGRRLGGIDDVTISGLTVTDTRASASRQIGVVVDNSDPVSGIRFTSLRLAADPQPYQGNAPITAFTLTGVTAAGRPVHAS